MEKPTLIGMIWRPHIEMDRLREQPRILWPFIWLLLCQLIGYLMISHIKKTVVHIYPSGPTEVQHHFASFEMLLIHLSTFVCLILLSTSILYGITRFSHSAITFAQLFSLHLYLQVIHTLRLLTQGVLHLLGIDKPILALVETGQSPITVFTLWSIALAFIGYTRLIKLSKWSALLVAIILGLLPYLLIVLISPPQ